MSKPNSKTVPDAIPDVVINESGEFEPEATRTDAPTFRGVGGVVLRELTLRDEQDADGYHNLTPIRGGYVATREMSDADLETFVTQIRAFKSALAAPMAVEEKAIELANAGKFDEANALRAQSQADSQAAQIEYMRANAAVMDKHVVGWDLKVPYTERGWKRLRADDYQAVARDIAEKSLAGREDEGFLADDLPAI